MIDIEVGISYDADIKEVKRILTDIAKNEKRILDQDGVNIFVLLIRFELLNVPLGMTITRLSIVLSFV